MKLKTKRRKYISDYITIWIIRIRRGIPDNPENALGKKLVNSYKHYSKMYKAKDSSYTNL